MSAATFNRDPNNRNNVLTASTIATIEYDGMGRRIVKKIENSADWDCTCHCYNPPSRGFGEASPPRPGFGEAGGRPTRPGSAPAGGRPKAQAEEMSMVSRERRERQGRTPSRNVREL